MSHPAKATFDCPCGLQLSGFYFADEATVDHVHCTCGQVYLVPRPMSINELHRVKVQGKED